MPYAVRDQGIAMRGFAALNQALTQMQAKADFGLEYEMQRRLRMIGEVVAKAAPGNVTHATGRHGDPSNPTLEESVRVSVTARQGSVYSTALHGGVQNVGGGPHAGWGARGPHVQRSEASGWMNKAVGKNSAYVQAQMEELINWLLFELNADRGES
jgi:hypothetical protein